MIAIADEKDRGLHYNVDLVRLWRERAKVGPYRISNDVQANSPGGWTRIEADARKHLANPSSDKYSTAVYKGTGCVPNLNQTGYVSTHNPTMQGVNLRDAGFYYLVTGDTQYAASIRSVLLAEASNSLLDFTNTSRWCPGGLNDLNPGFPICEWLTRLLYGYDYIKATLSAADKAKLNGWLLGAASYMRTNVEKYINSLFVNSPGGDYTLTATALNLEKGAGSLLYYGGPKARYSSRQYNNRRAAMVAFVGLAGVFLGNESHTNWAIRFFKELIMFGIYPTGYYVDFLRGVNSTNPEKGFAYSTNGAFIAFSTTLGMAGNTELLDFETILGTTSATSGTDASSNGTTKKGLRMHMKAMLDLRNHIKAAYATSYPENVGKEFYRIDGITPGDGYSVRDTVCALPNIYYKDEYIKASYLRKAPGSIPYPSNPQPDGDASPWTLGGFPDMLFMFGQMEGKVWPFNPVTTPDPVPDPVPVPTTQQVVSFVLVNADTDQDIQPLTDGASLNLATLPTKNLNVRANCSPATVGSVVFNLSGQQTRNATESGAPYALFGDAGNGNYNAWVPEPGSYSLKATPFSAAAGGGTAGTALLVSFSVILLEWIDYDGEVEENIITGALRKKV